LLFGLQPFHPTPPASSPQAARGRLASMVTMSRSLALGAIVAVGILVTSWANATAHPSDHPHLKRIADIQVGDEVLAWDEPATHDQRLEQQSYQKVTEVFNTPERIRTLVHLTLDNGQTLTATDGHPLKTEEGWRDAVLLKPPVPE
jgi:hypothetical protein